MVRLAAATILILAERASAFWILSHSTLTIDRLDPIIEPGKVSSHVHTVIGASAFGPTVSVESLQASNCTTSPVQDDSSSYWAPQLYRQNTENKTFTPVPIQYVNTYCELYSPFLLMCELISLGKIKTQMMGVPPLSLLACVW